MWNEVRALIRAELVAVVAELKQLKPWARLSRKQRDERPEARPQARFDLRATKWKATALCTLIAHSRGRVHRRQEHDGLAAQAAEIAAWLEALEAERGLPLLDGNIRAAARVILDRRVTSQTTRACVAPTVEHRA